MAKFSASIDAWIAQSEKRLRAVAQASIQDVINEASKPKGKGGNMPVDTGFLRASGQVSFNGMPSGPGRGDTAANYSNGDPVASATVEIAKLTLGQTLFFGWTANYARIQEARNAFLRLAVQQWPTIVAVQVALAKTRSGIK